MTTPAELLALARRVKEAPMAEREANEDVPVAPDLWDAAQILADAILTGEPQRSMSDEELRAQGLARIAR